MLRNGFALWATSPAHARPPPYATNQTGRFGLPAFFRSASMSAGLPAPRSTITPNTFGCARYGIRLALQQRRILGDDFEPTGLDRFERTQHVLDFISIGVV
jgi:hypothetical protein